MRHTTTGRWQRGLALALLTSVMWGLLPIALKLTLGGMDANTITWYRFVVAAVLLGAYLSLRRGLPRPSRLGPAGWWLLPIAILGLAGNYLLYLLGLDRVSPGTAQTVIQLAPLFLLIGGLVVFGERFSRLQWFGLAVLVGGLLLFFNRRLAALLGGLGGTTIGVLLVVAASVVWAAYALAQKQLLRDMPSADIMWMIYAASAALFLPVARPAAVLELSGLHLAMLAFACINTLIAYGSFAEALDHWEASKVGAVLALTPLLTLVFMAGFGALWPGLLPPEQTGVLALLGVALVVVGSALCAIGRSPARPLAV